MQARITFGVVLVWLAMCAVAPAAGAIDVSAEVPPVTPNGVDTQERSAVSFDGTNYLVAWFERSGASPTGTVRAARVAANGTALDPDGITLATGVTLPSVVPGRRALVAASSASGYLVVWQTGTGDIRAARIATNGTLLDASPGLAVASSASEEKEPAVTAGGANGWFVAYTRVNANNDVLGTRITTAGAVLDPAGLAMEPFGAGSESAPAVAYGNGEYHVAYYFPASGLVRLLRVTTGGSVSDYVQVTTSGGAPLIAASSTELLVGWTLPDTSIWAGRYTFLSAASGSARFLGSSTHAPQIVSTGGGWVAALAAGSTAYLAYFASDLTTQARDDYASHDDPALVAGPSATVGLAYSRVDLGVRRVFLKTVRRHSIASTVTQHAATEGQNVVFRVALGVARPDATVTVDYQVSGGSSATIGSDTPANVATGTVTFPPGSTEQFVVVPTIDDAVDEEDIETIFLTLLSATNADVDDEFGVHRTSGFANIGDNDPSPNVSGADVSVDESAGTATVTLQLSAAGERRGRVYLTNCCSPNPSTASASDFTFPMSSVEVEFLPGQTQKSIQVPITNDAIDEPAEFFELRVSGAFALNVTDEFLRVTINDDDPTPSMSVVPVSVPESNPTVQVAVTLTNPSSQTITATLATSDGTAMAPGDYTAIGGTTVTFNPGQTARNSAVTVISDSLDEVDETFTVTLSSPVNATISEASAAVTIVDDDGPTLAVGDATIAEGAILSFALDLSAPTVQAVTGSCATSNGSATAGADYVARSGAAFTIPAGELSTSVTVDTIIDALDEVDESLTLTCTVGSAAGLSDGVAVGTVSDDDAQPVMSVIAPGAELEGDNATHTIVLAVRLSAASGRTVTATLSTADVTATAPGDYSPLAGVAVTFAAGETEKLVALSVAGDTIDESDELFTAMLSTAVGAGVPVPGAPVVVLDDDGPVANVTDARAREGARELTFHIRLAAASPQEVTGSCATANGTARAGTDYVASVAPFVVPAGSTEVAFAVRLLVDAVNEPVETLTLSCSVDRSAELGDGSATGTIVPPPPARIVSTALAMDRFGRVPVTLACPISAGATACTGRVTVTSATRIRIAGRLVLVSFGRVSYSVPRGRTGRAVVRLTSTNLLLVRRLGSVRVIINASPARRTVTLRPA